VKTHNPTPWLRHFGLNHAVEQPSDSDALSFGSDRLGPERCTVCPGNVAAQYRPAWANLVEALASTGMTPRNIIRMNICTTNVDPFMASAEKTMAIHGEAGAQTACMLLRVARLYYPAI